MTVRSRHICALIAVILIAIDKKYPRLSGFAVRRDIMVGEFRVCENPSSFDPLGYKIS